MPPWGRCPSPELQAQQWSHVNVTTPIWDNPVCTKSVVVTRGARAEMTCNSSNPIRKVMVCLRAPGREDCQPIFTQATPGCSSRDGWRLCVQGCSAKMVTEEAQDSQAGRYSWILLGRQRELKYTTLNVSGEGGAPTPPETWGASLLSPPVPSPQPLRFLSVSSAPDTVHPASGLLSDHRPVPLLL